jgi:hypothetical protein
LEIAGHLYHSHSCDWLNYATDTAANGKIVADPSCRYSCDLVNYAADAAVPRISWLIHAAAIPVTSSTVIQTLLYLGK